MQMKQRLDLTTDMLDEVARAIRVLMETYGITHIDAMHGHLNMFYQCTEFPNGRMIETINPLKEERKV